jgi:hypothetical protein
LLYLEAGVREGHGFAAIVAQLKKKQQLNFVQEGQICRTRLNVPNKIILSTRTRAFLLPKCGRRYTLIHSNKILYNFRMLIKY